MQARGAAVACVCGRCKAQASPISRKVPGVVLANTDCCDQVGFLPLAAVFTSSTTHQCPTTRESNPSLTSLTQSHFPLATAMFRDPPAQEIFLCSNKGHHAELCSTHSHGDGFKPVDSQLEKVKVLMALILLTIKNTLH